MPHYTPSRKHNKKLHVDGFVYYRTVKDEEYWHCVVKSCTGHQISRSGKEIAIIGKTEYTAEKCKRL
jgi:hypothetical protein